MLLGGDPLVYECKTKYKGKWYMPGDEVPEEKSPVPSDFMNPPKIENDCEHVYHLYRINCDVKKLGVKNVREV